jgi:hypothetical protein
MARTPQQTFTRLPANDATPEVRAAINDIYDKLSVLTQGDSFTIEYKRPDDSTGTLTFTQGRLTAHT